MTRTVLVRLAAGVVVLFGAWVAYTQAPQAPAQLNLQKIKDDLYMIEGDGGNVAVYLTNDGVILIDDKFERDFNDIMAKVKSVTDKPVKYVLNTHQHGDHTGSNEKLLPIAEIIAHKNARANMEKNKQPGLMRVVFNDESDVFLGGKEVRMKYYGRGHTNGDAVVYFPALRVLHTGDLFVASAPLIDYANGGSAGEWAATLDGALKLDFDTVIPGHGPVSKKEDLMKFRDNMRTLSTRVSGMVREGKSKDEVAKMLTGDLGWPQASAGRAVDGMMVEFKR
ncbi:MAG: MBL fold metallo-hydrolase [Bryobacteraceae bacterium]|jgi:glyoxylase-like metal-dependent hydrolase (beta-lactamase superfamily II)